MVTRLLFAFALLLFALVATPCLADNVGKRVKVISSEGVFKGEIIAEDAQTVTIRTDRGLEIRIPRSEIGDMVPTDPLETRKLRWSKDPNYSRLMFAPSGRPLKRGHGYLSNHYIFLPGLAYGLTNQISIVGGLSIVPGASLSDQLFYVAPKIGVQFHKNFAASVGTLFFSVNDASGAVLFGATTIGPNRASVTLGAGWGYLKGEDDEDYTLSEDGVIMIGSNFRLSNSVALVTESWIFTSEDVSANEFPFGVALRFFGERVSVDFGLILIGEVLEEGLPVPWLSGTYSFGR